jgi:hypothetical protein
MRSIMLLVLLSACSGSSPAPLLLTASPMQEEAMAGVEVVDIGLTISGCASATTTFDHQLRKKQGVVTIDAPITDADYDDLVTAAAVSRSEFDDVAEEILGSWWTNLPETSGNLGQTLLHNIFVDQLDACGC